MINWPSVGVLDLSVAHSDLHELASLVVLAFVVLWELRSGLTEFVEVFLALSTDHVVSRDLLLHPSVLDVLVHGGLSNWDNGVYQIPKNTFDKWGGGEGTLIGESLVEVDQFDKLAKVKRTLLGVLLLWSPVFSLSHVVHHYLSMLLLVNQSGEELVVI